MKKFTLFLIVCFAAFAAQAQFSDSRWQGAINLDTPTEIILDFKADTVDAILVEDNSTVETMQYSVEDSVLVLKKIAGQSECDDTIVGKYKFEMGDDGLRFIVLEDACDDRSHALDNTIWTKQE